MLRKIAPAGTSISFSDITGMLATRAGSDLCLKKFKDNIKFRTGAKYCFLLNSGRAALNLILKALAKQTDPIRNEVVIPAYTCFSVPAAIVKSGLKIRPVDVNPMTMDYDYDRLNEINFSRVLTVISCNLMGILSNWKRLLSIAADKGVFLVDDAAQSWGSSYDNRSSGCLGDVGFYSMGRGKNISTYSGGVILTSNDVIARELGDYLRGLERYGFWGELKVLIMIILYSLFLRPRLYWIPDAIPHLKLGQTVYDINFKIRDMTLIQGCLGDILYAKLDSFNSVRIENSRNYADNLLKMECYEIPGYSEKECPAYIRFPLLFPDRESRDRAIDALDGIGVVATSMYPSTVRDIQGIEKHLASDEDGFPGAGELVDRLLTLPTHSYVGQKDMAKIIDCLRSFV